MGWTGKEGDVVGVAATTAVCLIRMLLRRVVGEVVAAVRMLRLARRGRKGGTVCEAAATAAAQLIRVTRRRAVEEVVAAVRLIRLA